MEIIKFRIKNYKSIIDSGECYLTDNITILAGKNESGKTSILEALEDFDSDRQIRNDAIPIINDDLKPAIEVTFQVSQKTINELLKKAGVESVIKQNLNITIIKEYPDNYSLEPESMRELGLSEKNKQETIEQLEKLFEKIKEVKDKYPNISSVFPSLDFNNLQSFQTQVALFNQQVNSNIGVIPNEEERNNLKNHIQTTIQLISDIQSNQNQVETFLKAFKGSSLPYFILYSSFEDEFPHTIPISQLESDEWAKDLSEVSNFSPQLIVRGQERQKKEHKTKINVELKGKFQKYWTQDPISLEIDWDSNNVYFWIEEGGHYYEPKQRSKGQQWHISFYVKIGARAREDVPNIILIDEPGLYLHAKAQKDVLLSLEDHSQGSQVIFTTHSPYLIEPEKLNRVRLISKDRNRNTKISNKIHARADKETLTPILTAIGLELNDGIHNIDKAKNIVVEGPADIFYLQAFKRIINKSIDLNFIYGGGAGNMGFVGTILQGWGCKVIYIYDNDQGKKDGEKNLTKNWLVSKDLIKSILDRQGAIEDIFSKSDFRKYVLEDGKINYDSSNSGYVKKSRKFSDKVLLARLFLQKTETESVKLDEETLDNVSELFNNINSYF